MMLYRFCAIGQKVCKKKGNYGFKIIEIFKLYYRNVKHVRLSLKQSKIKHHLIECLYYFTDTIGEESYDLNYKKK